MPEYELVTVHRGTPAYEQLYAPLRADAEHVATMWQEAETRPDEADVYVTAVVDGVAAAWAGVRYTPDGVLQCCCNYERPPYRGHGLYAAVYAERHRAIVEPSRWPAVTFVFEQPLALHLADGWRITGEGHSFEPGVPSHHWYQLERGRS